MKQNSEIKIKVTEGDIGSARFNIAVNLDGQEEDFQLDTGSTYTSVSYTPHTAKYQLSGTKERTSASGKTKIEEKIILGSLRIGCKERNQFEVIRYRQANNQENRLGIDAFSGSNLQFDLKSWNLFFVEEIPIHLSRQDLIVHKGGTFGFEAGIGNQVINTLWDTGAELSVVDRDFVSANPKLFNFIQKIDNGVDATGEPVAFDLYKTNINVSEHSIATTIMAMDFKMIKEKVGSTIKIILGTNSIRGYSWFFDFQNKAWAVD